MAAGVMPSEWAQRYGRSVRHERQPTGAVALREYVQQVGADGIALLRAVYGPTAPAAGPGGSTPCSNQSAACRRTCSRFARAGAVRPPLSGYLNHPAYNN
ncbi:hypothetical protein [Micromonospora sp. ATCC 39149]|uniref:hypothetical protein n=1 Tax=Micromonospora sp. (strain ATCC 39149 / NRRL 15099 / SCC 1413) TaxID=219305 RepID=UPI001E2E0772|nr:hypothetical protein [Micromonospora sp. ATCC 39149]